MKTYIKTNQSRSLVYQWLTGALLLLICTPVTAQVIVSGGSTVSIGSGSEMYTAGDVTIADSSKISNCGKISLDGNWINNGKVSADSCPGIVEIKGSQSQEISGMTITHFGNLIINNPNGVNLRRTATVSQTLSFVSGKLIADGNDLQLLSPGLYPVIGANKDRYIVTLNSGSVMLGIDTPEITATAYIGDTYAPVTVRAGRPPLSRWDVYLSTGSGRGPSGNTPPVGEQLDPLKMCPQYWRRVVGERDSIPCSMAFDLTETAHPGNLAKYIVRRFDKSRGWTTIPSTVSGTTITANPVPGFAAGETPEDIFLIGELAEPTAVREPKELTESGAAVYPNPVTGIATVTFNVTSSRVYAISVLDLLGRTVAQYTGDATIGTNSRQIDLGNLAKGVYTLSIEPLGEAKHMVRVVVR